MSSERLACFNSSGGGVLRVVGLVGEKSKGWKIVHVVHHHRVGDPLGAFYEDIRRCVQGADQT